MLGVWRGVDGGIARGGVLVPRSGRTDEESGEHSAIFLFVFSVAPRLDLDETINQPRQSKSG